MSVATMEIQHIQLNTGGGFGMADFLSVSEAANLLGVSNRAITRWCKTGAIEGAEKLNIGPTSAWVIPKKGFEKFKAKRDKSTRKRNKGIPK